MTPEWLEVGDAQLVLVAVIAGLLVAAVLSFKLVRKTGKLLFLVALVVVLAAVITTQWINLRDCYETCDCSVFGLDISVPENVLCGEDRVRVSN